jgi:anionic cell wall polymer biosynthesis LytR-Cps2A-Psr (LCP) family protein
MASDRLRKALAALVLGIVVGSSTMAAASGQPARDASLADGRSTAALGSLDGPRGFAADPVATSSISYGTDGRLTVLLLGSDYRPGYRTDEKTDVILVASIDPSTKRVTMAGISRDAIRWPIAASNGGGKSGEAKVNSLYARYRLASLGADAVDSAALDRFTADVAHGLGIQIDYYAFIRFGGFRALIDHVQGLTVAIKDAIWDPVYQSAEPYGVYFPALSGYRLDGNPPCQGIRDDPAHYCRSALAYARSRKGTVGSARNSVGHRMARHQQLTMAAIKRVVRRGNGSELSLLVDAAKTAVTTDLPRGSEDVQHLFSLLTGATAASTDKAIFVPPAWGTVAKDAAGNIVHILDIRAIRRWADVHFAAVP